MLHRIKAHHDIKLLVGGPMILLMLTSYLLIQRCVIFPGYQMPLTPIDRMVPFRSEDVFLYISLFVMMMLPALELDRLRLIRFMAAVATAGAVGYVIFFFFPTFVARPPAQGTHWAWQALVGFDRSFNACPSLHATWAVLCGLTLGPLVRELGRSAVWEGALWSWAAGILWATLSTRQHVLLDLVAGAALGLFVWWLYFHRKAADGLVAVPARA